MDKANKFGEMMKFGILTAIIAVATPDMAIAASDMKGVLEDVASKQLSSIPYMISVVCYILGAFMLVSGALSLKKHAENPASEAMSKGIARLVVGGAITSVPALTGIIQRTLNVQGEQSATFTSFKVTF